MSAWYYRIVKPKMYQNPLTGYYGTGRQQKRNLYRDIDGAMGQLITPLRGRKKGLFRFHKRARFVTRAGRRGTRHR